MGHSEFPSEVDAEVPSSCGRIELLVTVGLRFYFLGGYQWNSFQHLTRWLFCNMTVYFLKANVLVSVLLLLLTHYQRHSGLIHRECVLSFCNMAGLGSFRELLESSCFQLTA